MSNSGFFGSFFITQCRVMLAYRDLLRNHCKPITKRYIEQFHKSQMEAARQLKGKTCLEVAFFLTVPGMWKDDEVFKTMQQHPHYHPFVVIYPYDIYKNYDKSEIQQTLERTKRFIEEKGYEYIIPYDNERHHWVDLKSIIKPDVVFFTSPYKDSYPKYYIYHYRDTFTCYVPYGYSALELSSLNYDLIFHNLVGLHFVPNEMHKQISVRTARNKGINTVVTGHPATEVFLRKDYVPQNQWKPQSKPKKKVIFAPHHTINDPDYPSLFLDICDEMLEIAEQFKDEVQFVFKPHQVLKFKLIQQWGKEKTEAYYQKWDEMENTQLVSDGYVDLFLTSDALIHDCGSFTTEYLFIGKPVMYLCRKGIDMTQRFNEFGIHSFECHYKGSNVTEIKRFLQEVVIEGKDPMRTKREQFFEDYLKPKDGILPSQKILKVLEEVING